MAKLNKVIKDIISLEGAKYNIDDISEETINKAANMAFIIGRALRDEIQERKLNKYCGENVEGKYVILTKPCEEPVYMLVRSAFLSNYYSTSEKCVCFQGTGFNYILKSPYSDNNWASFSTWEDVYIKLEDLEKEGCIKEITKKEFTDTFYKMVQEMTETFEEWKDEDCEKDNKDNKFE